MLSPLIRRTRKNGDPLREQRGVTLALVAVSIVSIIAMAALSIDIGTFYQAKAEAQRAADASALAAARIISLSGITGDPSNSSNSWGPACGGSGSAATVAATAVAQVQQNFVSGMVPGTVTVTYSSGGVAGSAASCVGVSNFGVNPTVTVYVQRANLPVFFARVFSLFGSNFAGASVSATATAEAFNPSGSGSLPSGMIPVQPRCVKPLVVPNIDPTPPITAAGFVSLTTGTISKPGISTSGVIGETFNVIADCNSSAGACIPSPNPPGAIPGILQYVPAFVSDAPNFAGAVPACATANKFQEAIAGCDQSTPYACGTPLGAQVDLTENPISPSPTTGDTATAMQCLTGLSAGGGAGGPADTLVAATYPFQIQAGSTNPLVSAGVVASGDPITTSRSIVTLPIYDDLFIGTPQAQVTIIGFLQVFINQINPDGSLNVTVMNVAGCGNSATAQGVSGTSPVPVRLITPP